MVDPLLTPALVARLAVEALSAFAVIVTVALFIRMLREERAARSADQERCHSAHATVVSQAANALHDAASAMREYARAHGAITEALHRERPNGRSRAQ